MRDRFILGRASEHPATRFDIVGGGFDSEPGGLRFELGGFDLVRGRIDSGSGGLNIGDGSAVLSVTAKTLKDEQAQGLKETIEGLQLLGKVFLGGSKSADKRVYARMVENARR